jgi:hypothetical protein
VNQPLPEWVINNERVFNDLIEEELQHAWSVEIVYYSLLPRYSTS